jgi:hypothetical protein
MSFACVTDYLNQQFYSFQLKNGECRLLAAPAEDATDDQGFPLKDYTARTADFILCTWVMNPKKRDEETTVADNARAWAMYEITVAQNIEGTPTIALQSDRIELRVKIGDAGSMVTCEIVSRLNQNNAAWVIYAVDLNELD